MNSRRKFIKESATLCCGVGVFGLLPACTSTQYVQHAVKGNLLSVKYSDFSNSKYVVVNPESLKAPVYIKKINEETYRAFSMLCTHKGCDVKPAGAILVCPCHGAEFSSEGKVLKGPATESLKEYRTYKEKQNIFIEIG